jgi:hypothetical protein
VAEAPGQGKQGLSGLAAPSSLAAEAVLVIDLWMRVDPLTFTGWATPRQPSRRQYYTGQGPIGSQSTRFADMWGGS